MNTHYLVCILLLIKKVNGVKNNFDTIQLPCISTSIDGEMSVFWHLSSPFSPKLVKSKSTSWKQNNTTAVIIDLHWFQRPFSVSMNLL